MGTHYNSSPHPSHPGELWANSTHIGVLYELFEHLNDEHLVDISDMPPKYATSQLQEYTA